MTTKRRPAPSPRSARRPSGDFDPMASFFRGADSIRRVAVAGAGLIGAGWVAAFLARGFSVSVYDPSPQAADKIRAHVADAWPSLVKRGLTNGADAQAVSFGADLAEAIDG